jgi:2-polyprenyl-3-methyl-5-hydroxy-6-metoxy-1,4-benzoquinol methylase
MKDYFDTDKNDLKNWNCVKNRSEMDISMTQLGRYYSYMFHSDIKHFAFTLSRYKFASKMLAYRDKLNLLELGCQEAIGALVFKQNNNLNQYVGIDLDAESIQWNKEYFSSDFKFICENFFESSEVGKQNYDAVVSLDVIEHISGEMEDAYCNLLATSLKQDGVAIVGTPSIMMSPYASEGSRIGHINMYDQKRLYELFSKYFQNVFIFNMNDELVNTGFAPMACYIFALCCNKR